MKHNLSQEEEEDMSENEDEQSDWEDLNNNNIATVLIKQAREEIINGDDPVGDPNWIPQAM